MAHMELHSGQQVVGVFKAADLVLLFVEGAHHAHTGQVFAGQPQHTVQPVLYGPVQRAGGGHDAEHDDAQQRDGDHKDQRRADIDRKGHDHGTDDHERAAQEQAQKQVQSALHLIHVAGHAGDEGAGAQRIHLGKAQALDVLKQRMAQSRGVAHSSLCRKILRGQTAGQADGGQHEQQPAPQKDIVEIMGGDADVDDVCHDQRHEQIERCFQHLEERRKDAFALVALQVA